VGYCLRVSCRTPVLGPALGLAGVGFASALAGQASLHARALLATPAPAGATGVTNGPLSRRPRWWRPQPINPEEALFDAVLGIAIFKAAGGRFSSLMPSDLAAPGALAFESLPAAGPDYAAPGARRELVRIFRRDGCHHCGAQGRAGCMRKGARRVHEEGGAHKRCRAAADLEQAAAHT
jgi:hypothetical protein